MKIKRFLKSIRRKTKNFFKSKEKFDLLPSEFYTIEENAKNMWLAYYKGNFINIDKQRQMIVKKCWEHFRTVIKPCSYET